MKQLKEKFLPFLLTAFVILADQITKAIIVSVSNGLQDRYNVIADVFNNGFLNIIHVRNPAVAFSMGNNIPDAIKPVVFLVLPILVLGFLIWYYFKSSDFTNLQRWAAAGIIGGGIGNIIDRFIRPDGVVDFIDVKFFSFIFSSGRWPTFNIADATVVVCCFLLFFSILKGSGKSNKEVENEQKN
jgi:signal peptidase II